MNKEYNLQIFILHSLIVAGKTANFANNALKAFIGEYKGNPFDLIKSLIQKDQLLTCTHYFGTD